MQQQRKPSSTTSEHSATCSEVRLERPRPLDWRSGTMFVARATQEPLPPMLLRVREISRAISTSDIRVAGTQCSWAWECRSVAQVRHDSRKIPPRRDESLSAFPKIIPTR